MSIYSDALDDIRISLTCNLNEDLYSSTDPNVATIQSEIYAIRKDRENLAQLVDDLAMLVKRLVRHPDGDTAFKAMDYLSRKNLVGSPIRKKAKR